MLYKQYRKSFNKFIRGLVFSALIVIVSTGNSFSKDNLSILKENIDLILSGVSGNVSVQVASADKYDLIYEYNPQLKMIPASITKMITAAAALEYLGTDHNFRTVLYSDDSNISDGIVNGNIYLKGFGDPDLNTNDLNYLAKLFAAKNITEVTGNLVFDESYLDNQYYGLSNFYQGDTKSNYWPYVNALCLNKNHGTTDPSSTAGNILADALIYENVKLGGIVISGVTPTGAKEIADVSHSMYNVLSQMNKASDNHSAITVFKVIGAAYDSPPGSLDKGESAVIEFLTSMGNTRSNFEILEGSGLTRYNTVNSDLYIRLLKYMYDDLKGFDYFYNSLAVSGVDGTLRNRMIGTEAEGNIHAKTGTLNSVSALSGYAVTRDNELLLFYIAMNGFGGGNNGPRNIQDQVCEQLCMYSRN
ncbi:MAG TPA: D-alanyl-D-alanine carboxypeptidase [Ignavibacteria bacterium]|nr:D-alanyl-D-alanine carboxypeptidase [Ignavibacteria bacterium]HQY53476.1 D-alanyl-D-alanine carboxypeptidase [Ignavibacteria bacterium]HRB01549.1 D-alanyl-D-alanine carboxypeptidase [Ignavibacteria bacterium]